MKTSLVRTATTVGMLGGSGVLLLALLEPIRDSLSGFVANIVPNISVSPVITLAAAAIVIGSAWVRRRLGGRSAATRLEENA